MTDKQRFISQALRRLSAEATGVEQQQVRELAGALFDEQQAIEARNKAEQEAAKLKEKGRTLTESLRTAQEAYKAEIAGLNRLLDEGAIAQETFARASEEAYGRMLSASREWSDGVTRALRDYADEAGNAAKQFEQVTTRSLKAGEDAFIQWARTGKFNAADLFNTIAEEAMRAAIRMSVIKPFSGFLENVFSTIGANLFSGGSSAPMGDFPAAGPVMVAHTGGVIGIDTLASRSVDPVLFASAPRFHSGGVVGGEVPIIAKRGETVFTAGQMRMLGSELGKKPEVKVVVNVNNRAPGTEAIPSPRPSVPSMSVSSVGSTPAPSPTYSLSAQGNEARLGQPIPVLYGRHLIYPDLATQSYQEFVGNEQYLFQLHVIGQGEYDLEQVRIEDTPISSFEEVQTEVVSPGGSVTLFETDVVTAPEVAGQELISVTLDQTWAGRGDEFNGIFDSSMTVWEALNRIARCGRAVPVLQGGIVRIFRDAAQTLPIAMFGPRNIVKGSFKIQYIMPGEETADSVTVTFFNARTWKRQTLFAGYVLATAKAMGIDLRWGGDWSMDFEVRDNQFDDLVHFEIVGE